MSTGETILKEIAQKEKQILAEEKKITEEAEAILKIKPAIKQILDKEQTVAAEEAAVTTELNFFQKFFVARAKKHRAIFQVIIVLGVVLVWRGLWGIFDQMPIISSAVISLVVGLILLWLFNKITDLN